MLISPLQVVRKFFDIRSRIGKNAYFIDHSYDNLKPVCGKEISYMPTSRFFSGWEAQDGDVFLIPEVTAINWSYEIKSRIIVNVSTWLTLCTKRALSSSVITADGSHTGEGKATRQVNGSALGSGNVWEVYCDRAQYIRQNKHNINRI